MFEAFWDEVKPVLEKALAEGLDAIHPVAAWRHGHQRTAKIPEGELMARIRAIPGAEQLPIYLRLRPARHPDAQEMGDLSRLHDLLPRMPA